MIGTTYHVLRRTYDCLGFFGSSRPQPIPKCDICSGERSSVGRWPVPGYYAPPDLFNRSGPDSPPIGAGVATVVTKNPYVVLWHDPRPLKDRRTIGPTICENSAVDQYSARFDRQGLVLETDDTLDEVHTCSCRIVKDDDVASIGRPAHASRYDPVAWLERRRHRGFLDLESSKRATQGGGCDHGQTECTRNYPTCAHLYLPVLIDCDRMSLVTVTAVSSLDIEHQ